MSSTTFETTSGPASVSAARLAAAHPLPADADCHCGSAAHVSRRSILQGTAAAGIGWLTPVAERLARAAESAKNKPRPRSLIVLYLQGGPSQLETFDPKPGLKIAAGSQAIDTSAPSVKISDNYPRLAEQMHHVSLVRSIVSKEGDHERGTYYVKTGYRPDPTLIHPSLGAIVCHETKDNVEIPRHVSLLPNTWAARGGYLGDQFDAFRVGDPVGNISDIRPQVPDERYRQRLASLRNVVEPEFARGRMKQLDQRRTLHAESIQRAEKMMSSDQLKAFNVTNHPQALRDEFGDTPFGRGCLAAASLIQVGVRCVEVVLAGWDTHASNHEGHRTQAAILDPACAALLRHLRELELLDETIVMIAGEFGRTPAMNPAGGRDHWPHGFTIALAGGGLAGGRVIGATADEPPQDAKLAPDAVVDPRGIADIHATILTALGIGYEHEVITPIGRPMRYCDGNVIRELFS